jgi:hypothetical protein
VAGYLGNNVYDFVDRGGVRKNKVIGMINMKEYVSGNADAKESMHMSIHVLIHE